ncbi:MAG: YicC family protein [Deltaproteobacteria bacterium]|nr:YicC family protein [Deltaproteobacteria bacterium]
MIRSMTAFGRGEAAAGDALINVEIRSVNHRFRDVVMRLPRPVQPLEELLRARVAAAVGRGRVEVGFQLEAREEQADVEVELNVPLAQAYVRVFRELQERFGADPLVRAETLCQFRDVVLVRPVERDAEGLKGYALEALSEALGAMDRMRVEEGRAIEDDFRLRISMVGNYLEQIESRAPLVVEEYRRRLRERISAVAEGLQLDENRLAQEVAMFAGRCDITEEIVRSRSHLNQFERYLDVDEPVGRRLEFLLQEMNREANTISSKASDASISAAVVEVKGELEKLREQVQNVE